MIQLDRILKKDEKFLTQRVTLDLRLSQHEKLLRLCERYEVNMVDIIRSLIDAIDEPVFDNHNTQGVEL